MKTAFWTKIQDWANIYFIANTQPLSVPLLLLLLLCFSCFLPVTHHWLCCDFTLLCLRIVVRSPTCVFAALLAPPPQVQAQHRLLTAR